MGIALILLSACRVAMEALVPHCAKIIFNFFLDGVFRFLNQRLLHKSNSNFFPKSKLIFYANLTRLMSFVVMFECGLGFAKKSF